MMGGGGLGLLRPYLRKLRDEGQSHDGGGGGAGAAETLAEESER